MNESVRIVSRCLPLLIFCLAGVPTEVPGQTTTDRTSPPVVFMEPDSSPSGCAYPLYRVVTDPARIRKYAGWMENDPARLALSLYRESRRIGVGDTTGRNAIPPYHIALVPGGNHAERGFCVTGDGGIVPHPDEPYIRLSPQDWVFTTTFLHETGHVVLSVLNGGRPLPSADLSAIPHSTAALTDRGTAFNEGFAIHLETIAARFFDDPVVRQRYHHDRYLFGTGTIQSEYHRQMSDLLTYSQTRSRYHDVAENCFSFSPSFRGPGYLRTQLGGSRDFSSLRDANQLLQSEGFYATFFYSFVMRGTQPVTADTIRSRHREIMETLRTMLSRSAPDSGTAFLTEFVGTYMTEYPDEAGEIADVFLELTHGVFVDPGSTDLWRAHYLGALELDLGERDNPAIDSALERWHSMLIDDPRAMTELLGPQIRCEVPDVTIRLKAFGESSPLVFDLNTAEEGTIRSIPGITGEEVTSWLTARRDRPFLNGADFRKRGGISEQILGLLRF